MSRKILTHREVFRCSENRIGLTAHSSQFMLFGYDAECNKAFYDVHKNNIDDRIKVYEYRGKYSKSYVLDKRVTFRVYRYYARVETSIAIYHFYSNEIELVPNLAVEIARREDVGDFISVDLHKEVWAK